MSLSEIRPLVVSNEMVTLSLHTLACAILFNCKVVFYCILYCKCNLGVLLF